MRKSFGCEKPHTPLVDRNPTEFEPTVSGDPHRVVSLRPCPWPLLPTSSASSAASTPTPHDVLGAHAANGGVVVRAFRPARRARSPCCPRRGDPSSSSRSTPAGSSRARSSGADAAARATSSRSTIGDGNTFTLRDPYRFLPTLGELDLHLVGEGRHEELYAKLGAHVREHRRRHAAPRSPSGRRPPRAVSVVGDFNSWDGRAAPDARARRLGHLGAVRARRRPRRRATSTRSARPTASCG